jgi:hypothetical protein
LKEKASDGRLWTWTALALEPFTNSKHLQYSISTDTVEWPSSPRTIYYTLVHYFEQAVNSGLSSHSQLPKIGILVSQETNTIANRDILLAILRLLSGFMILSGI